MEIKIIPHSPLPFVLSRYRDTVDRGRFQEGLTRSIFQDLGSKRKKKVLGYARRKSRRRNEFFLFFSALPCHLLSSPSIHNCESVERRREREEKKMRRQRRDKRERERKGKNRFCQVLVACLITALHERYALAAHEIT